MSLSDAHLDEIRSAAEHRDTALDPDARDLLVLAADAWLERKTVAADEATPIYLRNRVVSR